MMVEQPANNKPKFKIKVVSKLRALFKKLMTIVCDIVGRENCSFEGGINAYRRQEHVKISNLNEKSKKRKEMEAIYIHFV